MSGLGLVLSIAKDALAAQRYGINVTGHNIANVNTEGYSRQSAVHEAREPAPYGGVVLGRGVDTTDVLQATDQLIENRLMQQKSIMCSSQEMENYIQALEGLFNEEGETSISTMLAGFWNAWHDIANNPSSAPERIVLYEQGILLAEQFNMLDASLTELKNDLTNALSAGVERVNEITSEIAELNIQIVSMEAKSDANDLRDKRITLTSELAQYLDMKFFEQSSGSFTVVTAKGCVLVNASDSYDLQLNGTSVEWQGSGGNAVDITNYLSKGKLGGWLDMRDEVIEKYQLDLGELAEEIIWTVNQQHSQGVGLGAFSTVTGTYRALDTAVALDSSGLSYAGDIVDGGFRLWLYDSSGAYDSNTTLTMDASVTTIDGIVAGINAIDPAKISATTVDGNVQITGVNGYTFAFSDDTSNVLAALGINTFFTGSTAGSIGVNDKIGANKDDVAAAQVTNNVGSAVAGSGNTGAGTVVTSGRYTGTVDGTYEIQISTGGTLFPGTAEFQWRKDGGAWSAATAATGAPQVIAEGVSVTFMPDNYTAGDVFTIEVTADPNNFYGTFVAGDNTNALATADLQYASVSISQWTCDRINGNTEGSVNSTIENYYHSMVGSLGIRASSIVRGNSFNKIMVEKLSTLRDGISAVSLDEEMTNLIKFQYAYQAASKLISVSDELLNTLLGVK